ncbi:MAG: relaxase/mobilization nuclease domain-containing protein [Acidobacteriota bacterium]
MQRRSFGLGKSQGRGLVQPPAPSLRSKNPRSLGRLKGHSHLHLIVNVVDPETGKANQASFSKKRLSKWAQEYEREHGKIYCNKRIENNEKREQGEKVKHEEPELSLKSRITKLYQESDSGAAFQTALAEHGFKLAQGKKLLLIDSNGNVHSLSRQIDGTKEKQVRAKLADLKLPDVDSARKQPASTTQNQEADNKKTSDQCAEGKQLEEELEYFDRDEQNRDWQESIIDAAIRDSDRPSVPKKPPSTARPDAPPPQKRKPDRRNQLKELFLQPAARSASPSELNRLQNHHLSELGSFYTQTTHARLSLAQKLDREYGDQERTLRGDIAHLDNVLTNSSRVGC